MGARFIGYGSNDILAQRNVFDNSYVTLDCVITLKVCRVAEIVSVASTRTDPRVKGLQNRNL